MDTEGLPSSTAHVLDTYFTRAFGGPENWAKIQSIRFDGILHLPQGKARFVAFKKKPNLCKVVLYGGGGQRIIMAYDGQDAWQLRNTQSDEPVDLSELEALNFIRDAEIGGNLMYPSLPGKQIERLPGRNVEGVSCFVLQVTRPDGQQVEYALDARTFSERQMVATNAVTRERVVTTHSDFRDVAGLQMPFRSVITVGGEQRQAIRVLRVQVNTGVISWMFQRSAAAYIPPARPSTVAQRPVESVGFEFPGDDAWAVDFVLPDLSDADRRELLRDLDDTGPAN